LASLGFPVVGDKEYGKKKNRSLSLKRHFLHAYYLEFKSLTGKTIQIKSNLPEELKNFLEKLS
jgi:23S rRNA-/tRNA-specific pseudouridylate synthase